MTNLKTGQWYCVRLHGVKGFWIFKKHVWIEFQALYHVIPDNIVLYFSDNYGKINSDIWKGYKFELVSIEPGAIT